MKDERNYLPTREAAHYLGLSSADAQPLPGLGRRTGCRPPLRRPGALSARRPRAAWAAARRRVSTVSTIFGSALAGERSDSGRAAPWPMREPARTMPAAGRDRHPATRCASRPWRRSRSRPYCTGTDAALATTDTTFGTAAGHGAGHRRRHLFLAGVRRLAAALLAVGPFRTLVGSVWRRFATPCQLMGAVGVGIAPCGRRHRHRHPAWSLHVLEFDPCEAASSGWNDTARHTIPRRLDRSGALYLCLDRRRGGGADGPGASRARRQPVRPGADPPASAAGCCCAGSSAAAAPTSRATPSTGSCPTSCCV